MARSLLPVKADRSRSLLTRGLVAAALALCACIGAAFAQNQAAAERGAVEAARRYFQAFAKGDKVTLRRLTPTQPENFYGPFLFKEMPKLLNPRADGHRGLIDFEGDPIDPVLPRQGTMMMVLRDGRKVDPWQARGIFWKRESTLSVNPFKYSPTKADKLHEPVIRDAATKYLRAWQDKDWATMQDLTYDWLSRKKPLRSEFSIRSLQLKAVPRPEGSVRVDYTAVVSPRFPIIGLFRYTAKGVLYLVKEDGEWKIRGMTTAF